jgi:hypothetical protein
VLPLDDDDGACVVLVTSLTMTRECVLLQANELMLHLYMFDITLLWILLRCGMSVTLIDQH